jgi:hypothetical protein
MTDDLVKRLRDMCGPDGILAMRDVYDTDVLEAIEYIKHLEAALDDMAQYVSRADWHYLKTETIVALGEKKND